MNKAQPPVFVHSSRSLKEDDKIETKKDYKYLKCLKDWFEFLEGTSQKDAQAENTDIVN